MRLSEARAIVSEALTESEADAYASEIRFAVVDKRRIRPGQGAFLNADEVTPPSGSERKTLAFLRANAAAVAALLGPGWEVSVEAGHGKSSRGVEYRRRATVYVKRGAD